MIASSRLALAAVLGVVLLMAAGQLLFKATAAPPRKKIPS